MTKRLENSNNSERVILTLAQGNPGAMIALNELLSTPDGVIDILTLDLWEIYGAKIYMLWNDCCKRDITKLHETLVCFRKGQFTLEQIHQNLGQVRAKPFI